MDLLKMGQFIAEARKRRGLTQSQLGESVGLSGKAVSKWERGISAPDISILNELSSVLNVSISEILTAEFKPVKSETETKTENVQNDEDTANKIALSGIGAYTQLFKKRYTKIIFGLILFLILICALFSTTYLITNYNRCFVYKLSSGSDKFELEGLIASNQKENSLIITGIEYLDKSKDITYQLNANYIKLELFINDSKLVSIDENFENGSLSNNLKGLCISLNENNKINEYIFNSKEHDIKIVIYYQIGENFQKEIIPIKIEKKFSNNRIFY